jgi:hypothetical protein
LLSVSLARDCSGYETHANSELEGLYNRLVVCGCVREAPQAWLIVLLLVGLLFALPLPCHLPLLRLATVVVQMTGDGEW